MFSRFLLLFWILIPPFLTADDFILTSSCTIYSNPKNPVEKSAAKALQRYLAPILQQKPQISATLSDTTDPEIIVAQKDSKLLQKSALSFSLNKLKKDGFIIYIRENKIYIISENARSLWYGVYHFLERYIGYRFLANDFIYTPKPHKIVLKSTLDIQEPAFEYREIFITESDDWRYATQNRLNGRLGHRTLSEYHDPRYGKGINIYNSFTPYALVPQEEYHCNGQLPYGNKKVEEIAAKSVAQKLDDLTLNKEDYLYIQHEDRNSFCDKDGDTPTEATAAFLKYGSYIAKHLPPPYENQNVLLEAYQWTRTPPDTKQPLPKNSSIMFSTIEANFAKPLNEGENRPIWEDLKRWKNNTESVIVWHYTTNFSGYFQPHPNFYALAEDLKNFAKLPHIKGVFLQGCYETPKSEFANLRIWVFSKLLWNPDQNVDHLIDEFCRYYYGNAGEDVYRYIKTLHQIITRLDQKLLLKTPPNAAYLEERSLDRLEKILQEGAEKVKNQPLFKTHLDEVFANLDYIRLLNSRDKQKRAISKKRFLAFLAKYPQIEHYAEGTQIASLKQIIQMPRQIPVPPKESKGLTLGSEWLDFQEYTLKLCCAKIVQDPDASDKIAATMNGNQPDWGFQLDVNTNLPKGKWDIYATLKITLPKDHSLLDKSKIALFFGIHPTLIKGAYLIAQLTPGQYKTIKFGTIDTRKTHADYIWISPPENEIVKKLYVDRIFAIRRN
jgi:hypothetical protein